MSENSDNHSDTVMQRVRRALGRTGPRESPPIPPTLDEPVVRLVSSDIGLVDLFTKRAGDLSMQVFSTTREDLPNTLIEFLQVNNCKNALLPDVESLKKMNLKEILNQAGIAARWWNEVTLDEAYSYDAGVTNAFKAVAECGALAMRFSPEHGRIISLAPFVHAAIIDAKDILPDLLDLFELLQKEDCANGVCLIAGPSKTSDIEMTVVKGVHGPNIVGTFVITS
jgi:L-lactate dehydrogenase complex protein LldG